MGNHKGPGGYHWTRTTWMAHSVKKTGSGHCLLVNGKNNTNHVDCPKGFTVTGGGCHVRSGTLRNSDPFKNANEEGWRCNGAITADARALLRGSCVAQSARQALVSLHCMDRLWRGVQVAQRLIRRGVFDRRAEPEPSRQPPLIEMKEPELLDEEKRKGHLDAERIDRALAAADKPHLSSARRDAKEIRDARERVRELEEAAEAEKGRRKASSEHIERLECTICQDSPIS
eukprot:gene187-13671_t